jgi:glutaconyl-CoA/methylmalonyl-CoA decarboxylase subunit gamma
MKNFKFTIRGHVYEVDIINFEDNHAKIEVNGTPYEVELHKTKAESKTPILVRSEIKHPKNSHKIKKTSTGSLKVNAPLPGNIMQVFVKAGDEVKKGDRLLIYEAMKMENNLMAEKDGTIIKVAVQQGDSVLEGDFLIEMG